MPEKDERKETGGRETFIYRVQFPTFLKETEGYSVCDRRKRWELHTDEPSSPISPLLNQERGIANAPYIRHYTTVVTVHLL